MGETIGVGREGRSLTSLNLFSSEVRRLARRICVYSTNREPMLVLVVLLVLVLVLVLVLLLPLLMLFFFFFFAFSSLGA